MMIEAKDILSFNFYTYGQAFKGSYSGMRYLVQMKKRELPLPEGSEEGAKPPVEKYFFVATWPEPFSYENTDESLIKKVEYPFNEESYHEIIDYLNGVHKEYVKTE